MKLPSRPRTSARGPSRTSPLDVRAKLAIVRLRIEQLQAEAAQNDGPPAWSPDPDNRPQVQAFHSDAHVIGYGGQAGGGKTDLIIGLAATQHRKSIIFRRESTQLKDIIGRAKSLTEGTRTGFNGTTGMLTLGVRTIEFGAMKDPDDWEKYKGRPHDLKAYDEVTEILESQFRATSGWLRTTVPGQRCRIVLTFNPPTNVEGLWVVRYFAPWLDPDHPNPAKPGELRWYAMVDGKEVERPDGSPFEHPNPAMPGGVETIHPQSRTFIPARLADNKYLMATDYGRTLQSLPEPLRSQLLHGDFRAGIGVDPWQVIPTAWVEAAQARWVALEKAGLPPGSMTCLGMDVAHGGADKTAFAPRHDNWFGHVREHDGRETPDGASAAALCMANLKDDAYVNVDVIGWGASAHERLADQPPEGYGIRAIPVNFGERSEFYDRSGKFRLVNVRAEAYWRLREALDPENGEDYALPPDPQLKAELCSAKYEITPSGIKIEPKDEIQKRLGHSPNKADAVALAMLPDGTAAAGSVGGPLPELMAAPVMYLPDPPTGIPGSLG